jgi:hypothetical protein
MRFIETLCSVVLCGGLGYLFIHGMMETPTPQVLATGGAGLALCVIIFVCSTKD